jgi:hypothetical protein
MLSRAPAADRRRISFAARGITRKSPVDVNRLLVAPALGRDFDFRGESISLDRHLDSFGSVRVDRTAAEGGGGERRGWIGG